MLLMLGRLTPLVVVIGLLSVAVTTKGDPTDCNSTATVNGTEGSLKIRGGLSNLAGKTCEWLINGTGKGPFLLHLDLVTNLIISDNDQLEVVSDDNKTVYHKSNGFLSAGVVLIGDNDNHAFRVRLTFSKDQFERDFRLQYGTTDSNIQLPNIESTGSFAFPLNVPTNLKNISFNINLIARSKSDNLLLTLEELDLNKGKISFDKVDKYTSDQSFDDKNKIEFVLSADQQINMKIVGFNSDTNWKGVKFHYEVVDSFCSQYKLINTEDINKGIIDFKQPDPSNLTSLFSYRCLNIFEHNDTNAKFLLELRNFTFLNTADIITVLDGMSRGSKTIAIIDSKFLDMYWKQQYFYSSSNKIWIMYDSPQVINRNQSSADNNFGVLPLSQGYSYFFAGNVTNTTLEMKDKSTALLPVVYTFYSTDPQKQILIDFDNNQKLPGTGSLISISESMNRNTEPFVKMNSGEYPPDIMASNGNQMKVEINQIVGLKATVQVVDKGCHSSVVGTSGTSYSLSRCNALCSWLVPKRDNSNGTFVIQWSHLNLSSTDELMMEKLPSNTTVLSFKGPLMTTTFPDLVLDANETYVMYVRRDCTKKMTDNTQVLAVSLVYEENDPTTHNMTVAANDNIVLKTSNYPNYYSVGMDHTWRVGPKTNNTLKALLTFTDLDLIPVHKLLLAFPNQTKAVNGTDLSLQSDILVDLPLMLNLTSESIVGSPFSARGFTANVSALDCGGSFTVEDKKSLTISTPTSLKDIKKCVWMVTTDNFNNILNITSTKGKDDLKNLKIYDSISIRNTQFIKYEYFNESYLSSNNTIIIEYEIKDPNKDGLNLTFTQQVCGQKCSNNMRCMLPEWHCNGINDCGDWSDEFTNCNGTQPPLPPTPGPAPIVYHSGVNGWVVFLVICPLSIGIGVLGTMFGPQILSRFGRGRYREFQDFSEVS